MKARQEPSAESRQHALRVEGRRGEPSNSQKARVRSFDWGKLARPALQGSEDRGAREWVEGQNEGSDAEERG